MVDLNKALRNVAKTGKVYFGTKQALVATRSGKAKLLVIASNCPKKIQDDLKKLADQSKIPIYNYPDSVMDLGAACGKPFNVSVVTVRDVGGSDIIKLVEK